MKLLQIIPANTQEKISQHALFSCGTDEDTSLYKMEPLIAWGLYEIQEGNKPAERVTAGIVSIGMGTECAEIYEEFFGYAISNSGFSHTNWGELAKANYDARSKKV